MKEICNTCNVLGNGHDFLFQGGIFSDDRKLCLENIIVQILTQAHIS